MSGIPVDEPGPPNSGKGGRPRKPAVDPERRAEVARQLGLDDNDENRWAKELDLSLRDEKWLSGGPVPEVSYAPGAEQSKRRKGNPKKFTPEHELELESAKRLADLGYAVEIQVDEVDNPDSEDAKRRHRIGLPDLSSGMEIKTLPTASTYNTVVSHVGSAKKKSAVSVMLDFRGNKMLASESIDSFVDKAMARKGLRHAVVIYPDGSYGIKTKK